MNGLQMVGIQTIWQTPSGTILGNVHGQSSGTQHTFSLPIGQRLVGVTGLYDPPTGFLSNIHQINFLSSDGSTTTFGGSEGSGENYLFQFQLFRDDGKSTIVGFIGDITNINTIGALGVEIWAP